MKKFSYYIDEKVSLWRRSYFSVEADSAEEADQIARESIGEKEVNLEFDIDDSEYLYDTEENITPEENGGLSTLELFSDDETLIYSNGE